jgi:hypothetical protein
MTRNEELRIKIITLNTFACNAVDGVMTNDEFERHCQNFINDSGLCLGDAESYIELAIEKAQCYATN